MPGWVACIIGIAGAKLRSESSSAASKLFRSAEDDADSASRCRGQKGTRWLSDGGEPHSSNRSLHPLRRFGLTSCTLAQTRCHRAAAGAALLNVRRGQARFWQRTTPRRLAHAEHLRKVWLGLPPADKLADLKTYASGLGAAMADVTYQRLLPEWRDGLVPRNALLPEKQMFDSDVEILLMILDRR